MQREFVFNMMTVIAGVVASSLSYAASPLQTEAERSGFKVTGRYDEVVRLCRDFQDRYPGRVRCLKFGETPEGRPMMALAASQDGALTPEASRARRRPIVFFQGGIHAGEIDGKDAGFWAFREWLDTSNGPLSKVTVLFVPVFNIDGHERFGPHHRPNQIGPEQMGWRTTGQNLNLNRDYAKADAPEMQNMLKLLRDWDPIVLADLHVTDGAKFQHVISITVSPGHLSRQAPLALPWEKSLNDVGHKLEKNLEEGLTKSGHLPLTVYPSFEFDENDAPKHYDPKKSSIKDGISSPRFSHAYWGLHHRIGILVETHSWKDYETRVRATHDTLTHLVTLAARDGASWLSAAREADQGATREAAGREVALRYSTNTETGRDFDFRGYVYQNLPSAVSCENRIVYDVSQKEVWKVKLFDELQLKKSVHLPQGQGGYIVPAAHAAWVSRKLALHGIRYNPIKRDWSAIPVEIFRASDKPKEEPEFGSEPERPKKRSCNGDLIKGPDGNPIKGPMVSFEGRQLLKVNGEWASAERAIGKGSLFVPIAQPLALLVANLLEPAAPDSLLAWGFFNAAFEHKEYMEDYVAEEVALDMLEKQPSIRDEFYKKRQEDPQFKEDPVAQLEFFYRSHPSWDERLNLYPVLRVGAPLK